MEETDNVYEYSFALAEEQELTGRELELLGTLFQAEALFADVPIERHQIVLEHMKLVNEFLQRRRAERG